MKGDDCGARLDRVLVAPGHLVLCPGSLPPHLCLGLPARGASIEAGTAMPRRAVHERPPSPPADVAAGAETPRGAARLPPREDVPPVGQTQRRFLPLR